MCRCICYHEHFYRSCLNRNLYIIISKHSWTQSKYGHWQTVVICYNRHTNQELCITIVLLSLSSKSSDCKCFVRIRLYQLSIIDIQVTTKNDYYDHIALLFLETSRCRYQSMFCVCVYLYIAVVIFVDYSDMGKMMNINTDKC